MKRPLKKHVIMPVMERVLSSALAFELQERLCNNYSSVADQFRDELSGSALAVLDIGCATGLCARQVIDMTRHRYVGIDLNPAYVRRASQRNPHGAFLAMDARELDFPPATFDRVLFFSVIHHLPDAVMHRCIASVAKVLKPTGLVLVAEPVFAPRSPASTALLSVDRGRHIRDQAGYEAMFPAPFAVVRRAEFRLSLHKMFACVFQLSEAARSDFPKA